MSRLRDLRLALLYEYKDMLDEMIKLENLSYMMEKKQKFE